MNEIAGARLFLLNFALSLGTFIQILDTSIANVAVPYIAGSLSVSPDQGTWVITSFAASNALVLPLTGWLSDYFGKMRLFVYSVFLFALTSLLCGLATSLTMLVILRTLQGAVAGSLIPLSQSLIMIHTPARQQGLAMGFWGMIVVVAPIAGPIIGGYLTYVYSWPWIFYINVPIGLFSASIVWMILKDRESPIVRNPIDWIGLFLLGTFVICMQIMLDRGKDLDWFESKTIIALTLISLISLIYFIFWTMYHKHPIVDFSFFKNRNFTFGTLAITVGYLIYFGSMVTFPLWLQTQQGYTAYWAGIAIAPIGIVSFFISPLVGKYMRFMDLRMVTTWSFIFFAIGFFYQMHFTTDVSLSKIMIARFLQGIGLPLFFLPLVQLSLGEIAPEKSASAAGIFNFIRILVGSGFGTSLSIYLWIRLEIFHHARLSEAVTAYNPLTSIGGALDPALTAPVVTRLVDQQVEQQAFMLATNDLSYVAIFGALLSIPLLYLCKNVNKNKSTHSAAAD